MKSFFVIIFMLIASISFSKKWDSLYINTLIENGSINKVIEYYEGKYNSKSRDAQDAFRVAELYLKKKEYSSVVQWYDKEKQLLNTSEAQLLIYANTSHLIGEYQKALDGYLMYAALTGNASKVSDLINQCEKALKLSLESDSYKLERYSYNTSADETNIAVLRTNPIYVTVQNADSKNKDNNYSVYQIIRKFENFAPPVIACNMNAAKLAITGISYSQDGNTVVFSAINTENGGLENVNDKIYIADNLGGKFLSVRPFPFNIENYSLKNPSFNSNGTGIYFSSNQKGGFGGLDIWESLLTNEKWTAPKNLGKLVNTAANENNPFLLQDGKNNILYFSSNREGSFGGYDIYTSKKINNIWQDVEAQPAPVNSAGDDISIIYDDEIKTGYFSSNRSGGKGGFDIYRFMPFNLKLAVHVVDSATKQPVDYALVQMLDNTNKAFESITDGNGNTVFQIAKDKQFHLLVSKEKYNPYTVTINSAGKLTGDSLLVNAYLHKSNSDNIANKNPATTPEDYIIFTGHILDSLTHMPMVSVKMKMMNYTTNKLREMDIDATGKFEIKLLLNNNYKIIFESNGTTVTDEITTIGMRKENIKVCDYLLSHSIHRLYVNKTDIDINKLKSTKP